MVSKNKLKKLSKRIREGQWNDEYGQIIDEYVQSHVPALAELSGYVNNLVKDLCVHVVVAGRAKRRKSIVRKVMRSDGCNIATLADLVGMRLVTSDKTAVCVLVDALRSGLDVRATKDYSEAKSTGYRAIHLYVAWGDSICELQVRTITEQLWAVESEAFGERVKEGGGPAGVREYLNRLSEACKLIEDGGKDPARLDEVDGELGFRRGPIKGRLPLLYKEFHILREEGDPDSIFVIVFDSKVTDLLSIDRFRMSNIGGAIDQYRYKNEILNDERFDVLLINSRSRAAMRISHPNYFPLNAGF